MIPFTRKERQQLYALLAVFTVFHLLHMHYIDLKYGKGIALEISAHKNDTTANFLKKNSVKEDSQFKRIKKDSLPSRLFINKLDSAGLTNWGFSSFAAANICKYRKHGGSFSNIEDLKKIYGVDSVWLNKLKNSIIFETVKEKSKKVNNIHVNINTADSSELRKLYGIGPVLAGRIVKYRNALGGFHDTLQILEVYGVKDSIFFWNKGRIKCSGPLNRIDLNQISLKELYKHYYFDYRTSKIIVNFRNNHGHFKEAKDLKKIHVLTDSIYNMIIPYCDFKT
jgi:competence ComEA-like helix-hairpin-helix protein